MKGAIDILINSIVTIISVILGVFLSHYIPKAGKLKFFAKEIKLILLRYERGGNNEVRLSEKPNKCYFKITIDIYNSSLQNRVLREPLVILINKKQRLSSKPYTIKDVSLNIAIDFIIVNPLDIKRVYIESKFGSDSINLLSSSTYLFLQYIDDKNRVHLFRLTNIKNYYIQNKEFPIE